MLHHILITVNHFVTQIGLR